MKVAWKISSTEQLTAVACDDGWVGEARGERIPISPCMHTFVMERVGGNGRFGAA